MNNLLVNNVSIVVGNESSIANDILKVFLNEEATVIAPAESSSEMIELRNGLCDISTSKLIALVTDGHDHLKILVVANFTSEQYKIILSRINHQARHTGRLSPIKIIN